MKRFLAFSIFSSGLVFAGLSLVSGNLQTLRSESLPVFSQAGTSPDATSPEAGTSTGATTTKVVTVVEGGPLIRAPFGLDFLPNGDAVFADYGAHRILRIDSRGKTSLIAGSGKKGAANGKGEEASFNSPHNLCVTPEGKILVADTFNHLIREVNPETGEVITVAGTTKGFSGDNGPADKAQFNETYHVALDGKDGLIVVDLMNKRIRRIDRKTNTVATIAGTGKKAPFIEGSKALEANLTDPRAAARGPDGSLWVLERGGNTLRKVDPTTGAVTTIVGTGKAGPVANGPAKKATLKGPKYLWINADNSILIADSANEAVRLLDKTHQTLTTIIGTGIVGKGPDGGNPVATALNHPHGVAVDSKGRIWISDSTNKRVLRIEPK